MNKWNETVLICYEYFLLVTLCSYWEVFSLVRVGLFGTTCLLWHLKKPLERSLCQAKHITTLVVIQTERDDGQPSLVVAPPVLHHRCFCPSSLLGEVWLHIIIITHGVSIGTEHGSALGAAVRWSKVPDKPTRVGRERTKNLLRDGDVIGGSTFFRGHNHFTLTYVVLSGALSYYARFEIPPLHHHNRSIWSSCLLLRELFDETRSLFYSPT